MENKDMEYFSSRQLRSNVAVLHVEEQVIEYSILIYSYTTLIHHTHTPHSPQVIEVTADELNITEVRASSHMAEDEQSIGVGHSGGGNYSGNPFCHLASLPVKCWRCLFDWCVDCLSKCGLSSPFASASYTLAATEQPPLWRDSIRANRVTKDFIKGQAEMLQLQFRTDFHRHRVVHVLYRCVLYE
jgi:hypothetical protein